jgi:RNA polymerase sigma-32 factor
MNRSSRADASDSFRLYLAEINQHPLLTAEEEQSLARAYANGDARAAHRLITANLRFVVKVAYEYRSYGTSVSDLVQEGNIGLMKAVQKFDPERGIRFISYAVWWIRAYVQNHILRSFSLVKLGTTQAQRKLFFSLARTKRELDKMSAEHGQDSDGEDIAKIAKKMSVKPGEVEEMSQRMGRDVSLDAPVGDGDFTQMDFLAGDRPAQDQELFAARERTMLQEGVGAALAQLDPRERFIVEQRVMSDEPMSLKDLGQHFGFSRERARQLETRAKAKLGDKLHALAVEVDWPTEGEAFVIDDAAVV